MSVGKLRFIVIAVALLHAVSLYPQTAQAPTATITSSTELVLVPAVVHNGSGSHMSGLTKEGFVLKQDGKARPIAIFEEVKTTAGRVHRSEGKNGTFSNLEAGDPEYHRLSIIVFDLVNTPLPDQANARAALAKFLTELAGSGEPLCLLAFTATGLTVLHDFTDDPKLLADGLARAMSGSTLIHESIVDPHHPTGDALAKSITALIRGELQGEAQLASLENKTAASTTVQALQQIAKAFRGLPGRKSLIWASSGFPFSLSPGASSPITDDPDVPSHRREEMQPLYDDLWKMMNDAGIAIYSIDLRSASGAVPISTGGMRPSDIGDPQFDIEAQAHEKMLDTSSTLELFAEKTGGRAFIGGGNLIQSFRQAVQDDSSYYMLGYYINPGNTKPGWHSISVSLHANGAHVRYRSGFFLSRDTSAPSAQKDIRLALSSPLDFTGMPVSVTWTEKEAGKVSGETRVHFELVMPANFAVVDSSDQNHMVVDIAAVARNSNGDAVADNAQRIDVHLKPDGLEQIQHNGMTYRGALQLPRGDYTVRFAVRDALGNRMGSVAAPVTVRP